MRSARYRRDLLAVTSALVLTSVVVAHARDATIQPASPGVSTLDTVLGIQRPECPVTGTLADGNVERGEAIYTKRCAKCHGVDGDGKGKAVKALEKKPKPWNTKEAWEKTTDIFKFRSTKCGGPAVGLSEDMPDYKELTDQQIWDVLAFAKTLRQPTP